MQAPGGLAAGADEPAGCHEDQGGCCPGPGHPHALQQVLHECVALFCCCAGWVLAVLIPFPSSLAVIPHDFGLSTPPFISTEVELGQNYCQPPAQPSTLASKKKKLPLTGTACGQDPPGGVAAGHRDCGAHHQRGQGGPEGRLEPSAGRQLQHAQNGH